MRPPSISNSLQRLAKIARFASAILVMSGTVSAAPCAFEPQGEGRVIATTDARSFRLEDGRDVRLAGIEAAFVEKRGATRTQALAAMLAGRDVRLSGEEDTPDRWPSSGGCPTRRWCSANFWHRARPSLLPM